MQKQSQTSGEQLADQKDRIFNATCGRIFTLAASVSC